MLKYPLEQFCVLLIQRAVEPLVGPLPKYPLTQFLVSLIQSREDPSSNVPVGQVATHFFPDPSFLYPGIQSDVLLTHFDPDPSSKKPVVQFKVLLMHLTPDPSSKYPVLQVEQVVVVVLKY